MTAPCLISSPYALHYRSDGSCRCDSPICDTVVCDRPKEAGSGFCIKCNKFTDGLEVVVSKTTCPNCNRLGLVEDTCNNCDECTDCCLCSVCEKCNEKVEGVCNNCNRCFEDCCECSNCPTCENRSENLALCDSCDGCVENCCDCSVCHNCGVRGKGLCDTCSKCDPCCDCTFCGDCGEVKSENEGCKDSCLTCCSNNHDHT